MRRVVLISISLLLLFNVSADENHYINLFVGDRAAGLAGAYTAIADGPEGAFYNPAGLAYSSSKYFSLSVNAIQFKMLYYHDVFPKSGGDYFDYLRYSFSFIPNFFGFIQRQKHFTFAITVTSADSEFYDQRDNATILNNYGNLGVRPTNLNVNFNFTDMVYEAGPSFAFLLHKKVSLGFNAFIRYRDKKLISQTIYKMNTKALDFFQDGSIYKNERIIGLNFQLGLQFMPIDKLSIGYSISTPFDIVNINTYQSTSSYKLKYLDQTTDSWVLAVDQDNVVNNTLKVLNIAENGLFRPLYIKQALGICVFISKSMLLSLDGYLYIPIQHFNASQQVIRYQYNSTTKKHDEVLLGNSEKLNIIGNVAIGYEWYITPNFPLRVGFFTNFSNTQVINEGDRNKKDHVHMFGGSLTFGFATSDLCVNLGIVASGGRGKAQIIGNTVNIQTVDALSMNVFISGGYQF
ncbi:MAG TPA: hypothetical protein PLG34_00300 [Spirochaetota bacterium]|jgi:long-chain fatty acid transport protein|nr:MAG: Outer membrane protein transport protein (OMPP1/FadL/TodX) [Spirochaetes bacterium ADurb.Bin133]HNZ27498.1 hypothetical protein [Spirochaetota bacterium]HPY86408.1 hypothetical protein [Spirochaetota bacterium]